MLLVVITESTGIFCGSAAQRVYGLLVHEVTLITHHDAPQTVGLLWTSDQPVAETSTRQHTTHITDNTSLPPVGFEPTIAAVERP
jgi:hypothetical protein